MRLCVLFLDQENMFLLLLSLISPTKWYLMLKQSQYEHLRKIVHHCHQLAKHAPQYLVENHQSISVSARDVQLASDFREHMGEGILNHPGCIVPAPESKNSAYLVASEKSARLHFVQLNHSGKVVCDDSCLMWIEGLPTMFPYHCSC